MMETNHIIIIDLDGVKDLFEVYHLVQTIKLIAIRI